MSINRFKRLKYIEHLRYECKEQNLSFDEPCLLNSNDTKVDLIIQQKNIKVMVAECLTCPNYYLFNLLTSCNGTRVFHDENTTIDFFILLYQSEPDISGREFIVYIIPKIVLIYLGYLSTSLKNGKNFLRLPKSTYGKDHIFSPFKSRYDLLTRDDINVKEFNLFEDSIIERFQTEIEFRCMNFRFDSSNIRCKRCYVNGYYVSLVTPQYKMETNSFEISKINIHLHDFYAIEHKNHKGDFIILPKSVIIEQTVNKFRKSFRMPSLEDINPLHWSFIYINNFDQLKLT